MAQMTNDGSEFYSFLRNESETKLVCVGCCRNGIEAVPQIYVNLIMVKVNSHHSPHKS